MKWLDGPIAALIHQYLVFESEYEPVWYNGEYGGPDYAELLCDDITGAYWAVCGRDDVKIALLDAKTDREAIEEFDSVWEEWSAPDTREYDIPSVGARNRVVNGRVM